MPACPRTTLLPVPQIMILSTMLPLAAGRFGLAPTANRPTTAGLKLYEAKSGQLSGDPAGGRWALGLPLGRSLGACMSSYCGCRLTEQAAQKVGSV